MGPASRFSEVGTQSVLDVTRYERAVRAYLGALLRPDEEAADDVAQEIATELQRGGVSLKWLRRPPPRLPFRRFLRNAVYWAAMDFLRRKTRARSQFVYALDLDRLPDDEPPSQLEVEAVWDAEFEESAAEARRAVIHNALRALEDFQAKHERSVYYTLARLKEKHPRAKAEELADLLTELVGRPVSDDQVRQQTKRMREKFAEFLVEEVNLLLTPAERAELIDRESFREVLHDLRLMGYLTPTTALPGAGGDNATVPDPT